MTVAIPSDGSEDLPLILAAAKFLDLLLVLQTEEFQMCDIFLHRMLSTSYCSIAAINGCSSRTLWTLSTGRKTGLPKL